MDPNKASGYQKYTCHIIFAGTPQQREGYSVSLNIFENLAYQKAHVSIFHRHRGYKIHGIRITTKMKVETENILHRNPGNNEIFYIPFNICFISFFMYLIYIIKCCLSLIFFKIRQKNNF